MNVLDVFRILNINSRSVEEAFLQHEQGGRYIHGWHTAWNNKKVYLRSSYEFDFAKELDEKKIEYDVEKIRILYWDSQRFVFRTSIPDFYLPDTNTIVEIKSTYTFEEQNMKDRFKAYREHGYKCKLILDHKEKEIIS
jgi:hypothetical protein